MKDMSCKQILTLLAPVTLKDAEEALDKQWVYPEGGIPHLMGDRSWADGAKEKEIYLKYLEMKRQYAEQIYEQFIMIMEE